MTTLEGFLLILLIIGLLTTVIWTWLSMLVQPVRKCPRCNDDKWVYKDMRDGSQGCAHCNIPI